MRWARLAALGLIVGAIAAVVVIRMQPSGPQQWTQEEAARQLQQMAEPVSRDLSTLAALPATATVSDWVSACRSLSTSNAAYLTALENGRWDPAVQPYVDKVIEGVRGTQGWYDQCRRTSSLAGIDALGPISARIPDANATANLREQLGLSPTP